MARSEPSVSHRPPPPRAPAVLARLPALEAELAALKSKIGETVLLAYEAAAPVAIANAAELDANIRAVNFKIEHNAAAHAFAVQADRLAAARWRAQVEAMPPKEAVEGITKTECCKRCDGDFGCVITGVECAHPIKAGRIGPRHQDRPAVREMWRVAAEKLKVY